MKPRLAEALGVSIQTLRRWEAPTKRAKALNGPRLVENRPGAPMEEIMRKVLAIAAIMALLGCVAARAEPTQSDCTSKTQLELRGTIIQTKITRHKYMAIALDTPICGNSVMRVWKVPVKWLGHHVIIDATPSSDEIWLVSSIKEAGDTADNLEKLSCSDVIGEGWNHMPDVTDYVEVQPGADKLGFGSPCHIEKSCFLAMLVRA